MKIYGNIQTRAFRCVWLAEELELEYEFVPINFSNGDHRQPWFLEINPNGKVPAFEHQGLKLFESGAICNYLASLRPDAGLIPSSSQEKALYDQWMFFTMAELEQPLWSMGKHKFALPAEYRIPQMRETALFEWQRALGIIEKQLEGGGSYILGGTISVPDIVIGQTLQWARSFKVPIDSDVVNAYRKRLTARPGFQKVVSKYIKT